MLEKFGKYLISFEKGSKCLKNAFYAMIKDQK